jgi:hypothetical protein
MLVVLWFHILLLSLFTDQVSWKSDGSTREEDDMHAASGTAWRDAITMATKTWWQIDAAMMRRTGTAECRGEDNADGD